MTRDELLEDLRQVQAQLRARVTNFEHMPQLERRKQLILDAIARMDADAAITVPTTRRYYVVYVHEYYDTEAQAKNRASITYGGVVLAVDVPITPTLTGTIIPETDP